MRRVALAASLLAVLGCSDRDGSILTAPDAHAPRLDLSSDASLSAALSDPDAAYAIMVSSDAFTEAVEVGGATFGPRIVSVPDFSVEADVVRATDDANALGPSQFDGCTTITNAAEVAGKIALIDRGTCGFVIKVKNAQNAGALAVIVREHTAGPPIALGGADPTITIPAVRMTLDDGDALLAALPSTARIFLVPTIAPTVEVPDDIVVETEDLTGALVTFSASGTSRGLPVTPTCTRVSGSRFVVGATTVTCTVTDVWQNIASASFTVFVGPPDTEAPTIVAPPDIVAELTHPQGAVVHFNVTAIDNVNVESIVCSMESGAVFSLGTTTVVCVATDAAENQSAASFNVTVQDTTPPALTPPANVVLDATSLAGAQVTYDAIAADASGSVSVVCSPASGSIFAIGETPVTCIATDFSGNTASAAFSVTIKGADAQIDELQQAVTGLNLHDGTEASVQAKLSAALAALSSGNVTSACGSLNALLNQVAAQAGKKIPVADAEALIATIERIRAAAGC